MGQETTGTPLITAVRPLRGDPARCTVLVDRRAVGRLPAADARALGLRPGMAWSAARAAAVAEACAADAARRDGLAHLARRDRTREELLDYLRRRGHAPRLAQRLVEEFRRAGWIDEEALARAAVRAILQRKPAGPALLVARLRSRGVDQSLAERVSREAMAGPVALETALTLARSRPEASATAPDPRAARRLATVLARRGFDEETIERVLLELGLDREA